MRDPAPHSYQQLPGARGIRVLDSLNGNYDAVFVIECSDIDRPGLIDLDKQFVVNIDHHSTTELFGTINWIDSTASAVGEMIYNLVQGHRRPRHERDRGMRLYGAAYRYRIVSLLKHHGTHLQDCV